MQATAGGHLILLNFFQIYKTRENSSYFAGNILIKFLLNEIIQPSKNLLSNVFVTG